jgi:hypothetical protein
MRSVQRRSIGGGVLFAIVAMATVVGCTAGLDGTPYGAAADSTDGHPSTPTSSPLDAGEHAAHWPAANTTDVTSDASPFVLPDSGISGADASVATVSSTPNCGGAAGMACEDCCFNAIPGANALNDAVESDYEECVYQNDCYDQGCYDFCNDQSMNDECASQSTLCHLIDNCMNANQCP